MAGESAGSRRASVELAREEPVRVLREAKRVAAAATPTLSMPSRHHVVTAEDVNPRHLHKVLLSTWEASPNDFEALLGVPGVGAKGVRALALLSEVLYGEPASLRDPARFSFATAARTAIPTRWTGRRTTARSPTCGRRWTGRRSAGATGSRR